MSPKLSWRLWATGLGWDNNAPAALSSGSNETQHRRCAAIPAQAIGLGLGRPKDI